jgi:predicted acyltransferase
MTDTVLKRRPIRGFLYGILLGLGLMLIVVGQGWAALGTTPPFIVLLVGLVLGTLWGLYAPAKQPKGEPPREPVETMAAPDPGSAEETAEGDSDDADSVPDGEVTDQSNA